MIKDDVFQREAFPISHITATFQIFQKLYPNVLMPLY